MFVSNDYKFCYQHTPKTGGTFIKYFFNSGTLGFNDCFNNNELYGHKIYSELENNHNYDLVVSVRNPIDRIVSLYCDICNWDSVTNFDILKNKSSEFYVDDLDWQGDLNKGTISDRTKLKNDLCKYESIEYFIENFYENALYFSKYVEDNIKLCKEFGNKVYILKQESLVSDLFQFCYIKKIPMGKDAKDLLLYKNIRVSNSKVFVENKRKLLSTEKLLQKVLDNEHFLAELYNIEYNL